MMNKIDIKKTISHLTKSEKLELLLILKKELNLENKKDFDLTIG